MYLTANSVSRPRARRRTRRPDRRGAAMIEFAIVLPVLVTIVLACIDFGRFAYTEINVTNAARVGAAYGSVHPYSALTLSQWQSNIRLVVANEMKNVHAYNQSLLTVPNPVVTTDSDGQKRVRVDVTYPFDMLVTWPFLPHHVAIKRTTEMRIIR